MSYRTIFREAVGEIPPTSIDVDRIIARQRRRRRLRRVGLATTAAIAVLGVTVPVVLAGGQGKDAPVTSGSPTPHLARTPRPQPGRTFTPLDQAVFAALARHAPDVQWATDSGNPQGDLATWNSGGSDAPYFGTGRIRSGDRFADFLVQIQRAWKLDPCTAEMIKQNGCVDSTGPGGEKIQSWTNRNPVSRTPSRPGAPAPTTTATFSLRHDVLVERPDGIFLIVTVQADGEDSPLTLAQLTALALDPTITLD